MVTWKYRTKENRQWWNSKDISGWTLENNDGEIWRSGFKGISDAIGSNFYAELNATRKFNALSQTVETEIGASYTLNFDLHRRRNDRDETVAVSINDVAANSPTANQWFTHSHSFIADSAQTTIRFSELQGENDSYGGLIDNIKLSKDCGMPFSPKTIERVGSSNGAEVNLKRGAKTLITGRIISLVTSSIQRKTRKNTKPKL